MGDKNKKSPLGNRKYAPTWEENPHQDAPNYGTWDDQVVNGIHLKDLKRK